jgi:uncharacterized SAM-dependent methyltransferase
MFLDVRETHEVMIGGQPIRFDAGEAIHTENSYKYDRAGFVELAAAAGFGEIACWMDGKEWFAVFLLEVNG